MRVVEGSFNFLEYLFSSGMGSNRSTDERKVGSRLRFFCFFSPSCVVCQFASVCASVCASVSLAGRQAGISCTW